VQSDSQVGRSDEHRVLKFHSGFRVTAVKPVTARCRARVSMIATASRAYLPAHPALGMEEDNRVPMAPRKTVAVATENLVRLGVERLATILLELANEQPAIKRRLRVELAGEAGGDIVAAEMNKRITALRSARSFIDWQKRPDFVRDLDLTRTTIAEKIAQTRPDLALDLMWRFMALAAPVMNRVDDSSGTVGGVFRAACEDLGALAAKARPDPHALAEQVFAVVMKNDYGEFDRLIPAVFPALGKAGITALKARLRTAMPARTTSDRYDGRAAAVRRALQDLADGERDVDAYMALVPKEDRKRPAEAAGIGRRLLDAGRADEAVAILEAAPPKKRTGRSDLDDLMGFGWDGPDADWESVYLDALDATGHAEDAQRLRWAAFEERLSVDRLRAYLKALPDFDDVLAEDRAMEHALGFRDFSTALDFFHTWPAHRQAAHLVLDRHGEINGNLYYLIDQVARWLEGTHPLAATLLRRAMVEDTLDGAKSKRDRHAARHLAECQSLASLISDYGQFETHDAFVARLRVRHSRKSGFWPLVADPAGRRR